MAITNRPAVVLNPAVKIGGARTSGSKGAQSGSTVAEHSGIAGQVQLQSCPAAAHCPQSKSSCLTQAAQPSLSSPPQAVALPACSSSYGWGWPRPTATGSGAGSSCGLAAGSVGSDGGASAGARGAGGSGRPWSAAGVGVGYAREWLLLRDGFGCSSSGCAAR